MISIAIVVEAIFEKRVMVGSPSGNGAGGYGGGDGGLYHAGYI
jgi:hypothetical protein